MTLGSSAARAASLGVLCLESWSADMRNAETVRPLLEVLSEQSGLRFIHRVVDDRQQLVRYLARWTGYSGYGVCYLACHGSTGAITIGGDTITLDELAGDLSKTGADLGGRTLYFGSCAVMGTGRSKVRRFRERTGLGCVCGYKGEEGVDWLESAAFELLLFRTLAFSPYKQDQYALRDLRKAHPQFSSHVKFMFDPLPAAARAT